MGEKRNCQTKRTKSTGKVVKKPLFDAFLSNLKETYEHLSNLLPSPNNFSCIQHSSTS